MKKLIATLLIGTSLSVIAGASFAQGIDDGSYNISVTNDLRADVEFKPNKFGCTINPSVVQGRGMYGPSYSLMTVSKECTINPLSFLLLTKNNQVITFGVNIYGNQIVITENAGGGSLDVPDIH